MNENFTWNLTQLNPARSKLSSTILTSNSQQNSNVPDEKNTYSSRIFRQNVKKNVLTYILTYFCQKSGPGTTLPTLSLPPGFTANTDHPRAWEVPLGGGLQSGAAAVNVPINYKSRALESAGAYLMYKWRNKYIRKCVKSFTYKQKQSFFYTRILIIL